MRIKDRERVDEYNRIKGRKEEDESRMLFCVVLFENLLPKGLVLVLVSGRKLI